MSNSSKTEHYLGTFLKGPAPREGFPGVKFIRVESNEPEPQHKLEIFVVPHTHADLCWPEIPEYCINACLACIGDLLVFQNEAPGFRFSMEHAYYLREYLARHPEKRQALVELMQKGIFECGAFYLGPTELTAGGEALVRELYLGKRWLKETLGVNANVCWNVDCPGHTQQLPQILARAGVPYFVIWKEFNVFEHDFSGYLGPCLFRWQAPDGSETVTCFTPGGYGIGRLLGLRESFEAVLERLPGFVEDVAAHLHQHNLPGVILVADGTDVERPTLKVPENIQLWNERFQHPRMRLATAAEFFQLVDRTSLPMISGEAPDWWDTVGSFQQARVMADRRCESSQSAAEAFSAFATLINPTYEFPQDTLERAWENRLFASEHNEGGRHGDISDALKLNKVQAARVLVDNALNQALAEIALHIHFQQVGIPIVVFNSLAWQRKDIVHCELSFHKGSIWKFGLVDVEGNSVVYQIEKADWYKDGSLKKCSLLFQAEIPSMGYNTFYLLPGGEPLEGEPSLTVKPGPILENDWFRMAVDPASGYPLSLVDKETGRELLNPQKFYLGELLALENLAHDEDEHLTGRSWRAAQFPSRYWLAENGPLRATWVVEGEFKGSRRIQRFHFYRHIDRIDIETELDWRGEPDLQMMQVFPLADDPQTTFTYEVPFGHAVFGQENPAWVKIHPSVRGVRNWVDLSGEPGGVTLAGETIPYELKDRTLPSQSGILVQPILLKTTYSCHDQLEFQEKEGLMSRHHLTAAAQAFDLRPEQPAVRWSQAGHYLFRFSIRSHNNLDLAQAAQFGWEHQTPLFVFIHDGDQLDQFPHLVMQTIRSRMAKTRRTLLENHSFMQFEGKGVIPTWVKRAEDGRGLILRCYEVSGLSTSIQIRTDPVLVSGWRTDLIEYDQQELQIEKGCVTLVVAPYVIETLRLLL